MALPDIPIDDRSFDQLFAVLRKQLPADYTDHNPSDPGIMLLELFCWLAEMELYRMSRVRPEHEQKFLDLLIDPPVPVTVPVTFTIDFAIRPPTPIRIAAGTRVATAPDNGRQLVFETVEDTVLDIPEEAPFEVSVTVTAREFLAVHEELLGHGDGTPRQAFRLTPSREALGLAADEPLPPLLVDFVHRSPGYRPNPRVRVDGELWEARHSLLTESSRGARHFSVAPETRTLTFGDGVFGAIPPAGSEVVCEHYQLLRGSTALIEAGEIAVLVDPIAGLTADDTVIVTNEDDASGGTHFFAVTERLAAGLQSFRKPYRLVTATDFERVLLDDFNAYQHLAGRPERVARAVALMSRRPESDAVAPGHITLIVLRRLTTDADRTTWSRPKTAVSVKQELVELDGSLERRLHAFLDRRRLIATRIHVTAPRLVGVGLTLRVVFDLHRNTAEMKETLEATLRQFLDPFSGGRDGRGWPPGHDVYRSELLRLVEGFDGVDHVDRLQLEPATPDGNVAIGGHRLPVANVDVIPLKREEAP